jgi:adenylosuccinate synthase
VPVGYAVIGAGFGDEGKGLITDFLARKLRAENLPLVVRCSGGAQAGHTVVTPQHRHVFSHVGSGALAGSPTFLSQRFIANPFVLQQELLELKRKGVKPHITVHPNCLVTTAFDMILNGLREIDRGKQRHGSCGLGINETVTRSQNGHSIFVNDLKYISTLDRKMTRIFHDWWYPEIKKLSNSQEAEELIGNITLAQEINNLSYASPMFNQVSSSTFVPESVIFEMSQGLDLDEYLGVFPHVTRAITGLPAALHAAYDLGITEMHPIYVTRVYKTRHGAGPLPHEGEDITGTPLTDTTNKTGRWQGEFRYAPLDLYLLTEAISRDLDRSIEIARLFNIKLKDPVLAVTHVDAIDDHIAYWDTKKYSASPSEFLRLLDFILTVKYASYGPTADDVVELQ